MTWTDWLELAGVGRLSGADRRTQSDAADSDAADDGRGCHGASDDEMQAL